MLLQLRFKRCLNKTQG